MIPIECKIDDYGFLYLDDEYIFKKSIKYYNKLDKIKSKFFEIESTDEYIVKYHLEKLNKKDVFKMLLKFYGVKANILSNIKFPIGYYKENNKIKGLIIPNYPHAVSLRYVIINNNLDYYYNHSEDKRENILSLLKDILKILKDLYDNGIIYVDVNPGNFVFYQNEVKIIDFDPKFMFYEDSDYYYLKGMLLNYWDLVYYVCRNNGIEISNMEKDGYNIVKGLKK